MCNFQQSEGRCKSLIYISLDHGDPAFYSGSPFKNGAVKVVQNSTCSRHVRVIGALSTELLRSDSVVSASGTDQKTKRLKHSTPTVIDRVYMRVQWNDIMWLNNSVGSGWGRACVYPQWWIHSRWYSHWHAETVSKIWEFWEYVSTFSHHKWIIQ